jgi:hypothetical protein
VAGGWWLVAGSWWLVAGGWWLVAGAWWLVAGGWWLVAGGWWLVAGCVSPCDLEGSRIHCAGGESVLAFSNDHSCAK